MVFNHPDSGDTYQPGTTLMAWHIIFTRNDRRTKKSMLRVNNIDPMQPLPLGLLAEDLPKNNERPRLHKPILSTAPGQLMIDCHFLQSHALFGGISDDQADIVIDHLSQQKFKTGEYLFCQDDPGDRLFLITQGSVEILDETHATDPVQLAIRGTGDSIGEMALIDVQNRSASVRALEPVLTVSLSCHDLVSIHQQAPELFTQIIINVAREISRRLRSMDALLSTTIEDANSCLIRLNDKTDNLNKH